MKKLFLICLLLVSVFANAQLNISFKSHLSYGNTALANIGGYVDSLNNEYALVGKDNGLDIVDVTDPVNPVVRFSVPGQSSIWREVKTWQKYAYVTTEATPNGLQIIDLSNLPASISTSYYTGDGAIATMLTKAHALHIDNGYLYLYGSNLFGGEALILNLANPLSPVYEGHTPGDYIHDGFVSNDTMYACHVYQGYFSVIDVTNKANPVLLASQPTPGGVTHNSWLNDNHTVLFTTDETSNSYLTAYDITDLTNITELDRIQVTPNSGSWIHNTHTLNDFEIISWYNDGLVIVDVARPNNMIVTGHYDTYAQGCCSGEDGCWGVYPYLPSGTIVASDITNGLYVLTPTYVRGCYLEGIVTDSVTGVVLNGVTVSIISTSITKQTKLNGQYKTGFATAGTYSVQFSKAGYITKTIGNVSLNNGILTNLDVQLVSTVPQVFFSGHVVNSVSGTPIANALVHIYNGTGDYTVNADANGDFTLPVFPGTYNIDAAQWGFRGVCLSNVSINGGSPYTINLSQGYYDDFVFDLGWTVSGTSSNLWERAVPIATNNNGVLSNPGSDVSNDCGTKCYVTDNGGGGAWDNDVDNGRAILTSPVFDATLYINPYVHYSRWFYNGGTTNGNPNDTLKVYLSNGTITVQIETANPSTAANSSWVQSSYRIADFLTPTNTMQLSIMVRDSSPISNIVEGGLDKFEVVEVVGINSTVHEANFMSAFPSPFAQSITLQIAESVELKNAQLNITDIAGRTIEQFTLSNRTINLGTQYPSGIYFITLQNEKGISSVLKVEKL